MKISMLANGDGVARPQINVFLKKKLVKLSPFRIQTSTQVCDRLPPRLSELVNKNNAPWPYIDIPLCGGCRLFGEKMLTLKGFGLRHQTQIIYFRPKRK